MKTHSKEINHFLRYYSSAKSMNSFSYLLDYYLRNGIKNYQEVITDLILHSKDPKERFLTAMRSFYSIEENAPFELIMNSVRLHVGLRKEILLEIYEHIGEYFRGGKNLNEREKKLYEIFQTSALKDLNDEYAKLPT